MLLTHSVVLDTTKFHLFVVVFEHIQIPCNVLVTHKPLMKYKWNFDVSKFSISIITIAEVTSITKRENRDAKEKYRYLISLSKIYGINPEFAKEAGILHAEIRKKIKDFGLADAFILLAARKLGAKILTGDPHFKGLKEAILI